MKENFVKENKNNSEAIFLAFLSMMFFVESEFLIFFGSFLKKFLPEIFLLKCLNCKNNCANLSNSELFADDTSLFSGVQNVKSISKDLNIKT